MDHIVQNRPGIRSGRPRSGFGQTHLVWKQAVVQESSGPVSGRTQPTRCQFPHFQTRLRSPADLPDSITVQNRPGSALVLADCVRFLGPLKRIRSGTAPASVQEHDDSARFWPKLPSRSGLGANGIRHVFVGTERCACIGLGEMELRVGGKIMIHFLYILLFRVWRMYLYVIRC